MPIYSHSRLSTFEQCPRRYWYAYLADLEVVPFDTIEAFTGSRVHDALEALYGAVMAGQRPSLAALHAWYEAAWQSKWHDAVRIVNPEDTADGFREAGRRDLTAYHRRYSPFDQAETLALESRVLIDLDGSGRYQLVGVIDRLDRRADGVYEIHDYKSSRRRPTQEAADADRQLALYQIGVQGAYPDAERVELVWHYLRHDQEVRSRRTPEQLSALNRRCRGIIEEIEAREPEEACFPCRASRLCNWCDFMEICPGAA